MMMIVMMMVMMTVMMMVVLMMMIVMPARVKIQCYCRKPFINILLGSILPKSVIPHNISESSVDVFFDFMFFLVNLPIMKLQAP